MSKLRVTSAFSGIGSYEKALKRLGVDIQLVNYIENDKYASKAYSALHNVDESLNLGDITKVNTSEMEDFDLFVYSPPCFKAGTMITTDQGIKNIEDVKVGDKVLTHNNRFRSVLDTMATRKQGIYKLKVQGSPITYVTEEHPYYVREMKRVWNNKRRSYERTWSVPKWKTVKELKRTDFVGFSENRNSVNIENLSSEECWLLGRFVADGYTRKKRVKDGREVILNEVIYCIGKHKLDEFNNNLKEYTVQFSKEKSIYRGRVSSERLFKLALECGSGAANKKIPQFIMDLPKALLESFLHGFMSGDGCRTNNGYQVTSASKELIYQLGQIVQKLYNSSYTITYTKRPSTTVIEGRTVNQRDTWLLRYDTYIKKQAQATYIEGMLWCPVKEVEFIPDFNDYVYNFEVEEDNSYVANNCTVHNCQSWSAAGKQEGFADPRGTLFFDALRIIQAKKPKYAIMENVKNLTSKKFRVEFESMLHLLEQEGYRNFVPANSNVLNSKEYGVPQNRERVFIVSIRKDIEQEFKFPEPVPLRFELKDVLEEDAELPILHNIYGGFGETKARLFTEHSPTIRTSAGGGHIPSVVVKGCSLRTRAYIGQPQQLEVRKDDISNAITTVPKDYMIAINGLEYTLEDLPKQYKVVDGYVIRQMTPLETWRLMGFEDDDYYNVQEALDNEFYNGKNRSKSQLYKLAGNSIVVDTLIHIFYELFKETKYMNQRSDKNVSYNERVFS